MEQAIFRTIDTVEDRKYGTTNDKWQQKLSFSERINVTSKMHDDYHERCGKVIYELTYRDTTQNAEAKIAEEQAALPKTELQIGRYVNAQHFKDGLFSEIFKANASDDTTGTTQARVLALKVTNPSMMKPPHDAEREARILSTTKSNQVIPLIETFKQPGGRFVLVFPYIPFDLEILLNRRRLTASARRGILEDVFSGLAYLHKLGIIHRDIKPSNILLSSATGPAYLADFGIAWSSSDAASEPAAEKILDVGTTCYRPPELLFGNSAYNTTLDLWAAGCMAAQVVCLEGKTLFDAGDLGSELALIKSIFQTLGTPDLESWPEAATFPDWGKMEFRKYPAMAWTDILSAADPDAIDLVSKLVVYESGNRLTAEEAILHGYFASI